MPAAGLNFLRAAFVACAVAFTASSAASAQEAPPATLPRIGSAVQPAAAGTEYTPAPPAPADLAQVVIFRRPAAKGAGTSASHVYVDSRLHAALMPNGFSRFCLAPGSHSIEAYVDDAPLFNGRFSPATSVNVEAGKTYFIAASEGASGEPRPFRRADAEVLLSNAREQRRIVSRAPAALPCVDAAQASTAP